MIKDDFHKVASSALHQLKNSGLIAAGGAVVGGAAVAAFSFGSVPDLVSGVASGYGGMAVGFFVPVGLICGAMIIANNKIYGISYFAAMAMAAGGVYSTMNQEVALSEVGASHPCDNIKIIQQDDGGTKIKAPQGCKLVFK